MAVEVLGQTEVNGHGDSMDAFRQAHEANSRALINLLEHRAKNAPLPAYDPKHPDNSWPVMVYHPAKGELTVGKNLKGVEDPAARQRITRENKAKYDAAIADGYRDEPYLKPQIAVLDPASEKKALLDRNQELEGKIAVLTDQFAKLMARIDAVK